MQAIPDLNRCHFGDCIDTMARWPDAFIQTVITSPPYWGLRDYKVQPTAWPEVWYRPMPGIEQIKIPASSVCLGLEPTVSEFIGHLVLVFRFVHRILRDDGTLWLNLGDSYAGSWGAGGGQGKSGDLTSRAACDARAQASATRKKLNIGRERMEGIKEKDMLGIPWRTALALQADGWYLRSDIIWHKPNPMPESVHDRPAKSHEYIFILSKSERYFYDALAVREQDAGHSSGNSFQGRQGSADYHARSGGSGTAEEWIPGGGRNKRSVWTVASFPYKEAHFATFPPKLITPCILAGTPAAGCCPQCRTPWKIHTESEFVPQADVSPEKTIRGAQGQKALDDTDGRQGYARGHTRVTSSEWLQACACPPSLPIPSIVFDPFLGSGTTGEESQRLGRSWIGCELNPSNEALQGKRTQKMNLL